MVFWDITSSNLNIGAIFIPPSKLQDLPRTLQIYFRELTI
jgi:hypothetical protein